MIGWGVSPFCELFPKVFRVASNKESVVSDYYEVGDGSISWSVPFRSFLRLSEEGQYGEWLDILDFFLTSFVY